GCCWFALHAIKTGRYAFLSAIPGLASGPKGLNDCLTRSTRRRAMAWGSGSPSAARSSRSIVGVFGHKPMTALGRRSHFRSPPTIESCQGYLWRDNFVGYGFRDCIGGGRPTTMSLETPIVFVVDDDISVRESLELLIRSAGWQPELFESAREFLARRRVSVPN